MTLTVLLSPICQSVGFNSLVCGRRDTQQQEKKPAPCSFPVSWPRATLLQYASMDALMLQAAATWASLGLLDIENLDAFRGTSPAIS